MDISALSGLAGSLDAFSLKKMLRNKNGLPGEEETGLEALSAGSLVPVQDVMTVSLKRPTGVMDGNFVSLNSEESTYLAATKNSFDAAKQIKNAQDGTLMSILPEEVQQAAFWYGSERIRRAKQIKDTSEAHEDVNKKLAENVEQRIQEAVAAQNAEGGQVVDAETGEAAAPSITVSSPSAPAPAPAPAAPQVSAPAVEAPAVAVAETPAAPAPRISINITV